MIAQRKKLKVSLCYQEQKEQKDLEKGLSKMNVKNSSNTKDPSLVDLLVKGVDSISSSEPLVITHGQPKA